MIAIQLPVHGRQVPAVETHGVDERERGQIAHGRDGSETFACEQIERGEIAYGADDDHETVYDRDEIEHEQVGVLGDNLESVFRSGRRRR